MSTKWASDREMTRRRALAERFFERMLAPSERPYFVSDEACLDDFFMIDEKDRTLFLRRCSDAYGVPVTERELSMHFWQLLDYLEQGGSTRRS